MKTFITIIMTRNRSVCEEKSTRKIPGIKLKDMDQALLPSDSRKAFRTTALFFEFGQACTQVAFFLPACRFIPNDCGSGFDATFLRMQKGNRKGDGERMTILVNSRNTQHLCSVSSPACLHDLSISGPMPFPKSFRYDQVERLTDGLFFLKPEDSLGRRIPQHDLSAGIGCDHCVSCFPDQ